MKPGPPTDPERWRQIEVLLDEALELPAGERRAFLDAACDGNQELRERVEALLAADAEAGGFLATPIREVAAALLTDTSLEALGDPLLGRELGPYKLVRLIGSGGMGVVYEAEDARLRRRVAIKLLPLELCRDPAAKARFLREARAVSALDDPNICTVHDIGECEGRIYLVMTFYEGETLKERLQRGPLPVAEARRVAIQVASALARAHDAGIVHRDVKPANVIINHKGQVKVLDFGIAKMKGDTSLTRTGNSPGTPAYMSPEQARGEPVDGRTDLWALGALLYEMLAGRRPFAADDEQAILFSILNCEPEPLGRLRPEVPPAVARIVVKALAKRPEDRYQTAAGLLADLETETAPAALPIFRRLRRRRTLWAALTAGVLVLLGILAFARDWLPWRSVAAPELKVAILRPVVTSERKDPEIDFVASEVVEASLATLISLKGLHPLDPPEADERGNEVERLRSAEADEVLQPRIDRLREHWYGVTVRRLRKPGGEVLATAGPFEVQAGMENALQLAEGVRVHLQRLYSDHPSRPESSGGKVRPQDYAAFIQIERRSDDGQRGGAAELAQLDALLRTSPDFLDACLLAADIARIQRDFDGALAYATRAQELAPHDPRPLFNRLRIEVEGHRLDAARATLARLTDLAPDDARVQSAEADLLEASGELEKARRLRQEVAQRRPTWRSITELATLEVRLGESASARHRLGTLLEAQPDNQHVRENLAMLEASSGDLKRAAALYEELIATRPARPYLSNLGFVRYLLHDYSGAAEADRRALLQEPDHLLTRFNLAAALEAQGDTAQARHLYQTLAKEIEGSPSPPDDRIRILQAQCLVRLGQREKATRLAEQVLKQMPEELQILNQAAQLYALLGDRESARFYTKRALKQGLRREWFTIPEFHSLKNDPDFQALLTSRPTRKAAG